MGVNNSSQPMMVPAPLTGAVPTTAMMMPVSNPAAGGLTVLPTVNGGANKAMLASTATASTTSATAAAVPLDPFGAL